MLPIKEIEDFVRSETKDVELITHDFGHAKRTAAGAVWFVKVLGGGQEEQDMAYVAGLLHDIVRPATEKVCHAKASAERSAKVLKQFGVGPETIEKIVQAIRDHRLSVAKNLDGWKSPLHQSVYLADKILEQMGAYVDFRRPMYVAECVDYKNVPALEAIEKHFKMRIAKIPKTEFPERFSRLVEYQWKWLIGFAEALYRNEAWALRLARFAYDRCKRNIRIEDIVSEFQPQTEEDRRLKQEATDYITGEKFVEFEKLI